jgi:hypothetical protein
MASPSKGYGAAGSGDTPVDAREDALRKALDKAKVDDRTPVTEATTHVVGKHPDGSWTASAWCK